MYYKGVTPFLGATFTCVRPLCTPGSATVNNFIYAFELQKIFFLCSLTAAPGLNLSLLSLPTPVQCPRSDASKAAVEHVLTKRCHDNTTAAFLSHSTMARLLAVEKGAAVYSSSKRRNFLEQKELTLLEMGQREESKKLT